MANNNKTKASYYTNKSAAGDGENTEFPCTLILAGGRGMRMRPLTSTRPKPLLPLADTSVLGLLLRKLYESGARDVVIAVGYMGDMIEKRIGYKYRDMKIRYIADRAPRGTAGCVKAARNMLGEEFAVLCADAYCELDLAGALSFHREKGSNATIVLSHKSDPVEYGIAALENDGGTSGKILSFREKPSWSAVFSDTVNTGIYFFSERIFDFIGDGVCDFGSDLFSSLIEKGEDVYGYVSEGEWCDIGDAREYLKCNLRLSGDENKNVIGEGSVIGHGARVSSSVLFENVKVGDCACIEGAIIGENCVIGALSHIGRGCVIGARSVISESAVIGDGVYLDCGSIVPSRENVAGLIDLRDHFEEGALVLRSDELTPAFCSLLGRALCDYCEGGPIGFFCGEGESAEEACALLSVCVGASVNCGIAFPALAAFGARKYSFPLSVCVCELPGKKGVLRLTFFDKYGFFPGNSLERAILSYRTAPPIAHAEKKPEVISGLLDDYCAYLASLCPDRLAGKGVVCSGSFASDAFSIAAAKLGAAIYENVSDKVTPEDENTLIRVGISESGRRCGISQGKNVLDFFHIIALLIGEDLKNGAKEIALPTRSPDTLIDICERAGAKVTLFSLSASKDECRARSLAAQRPYLFDGCAAAAKLLGMMSHYKKSVAELASALPRFCVAEGLADCERNDERASILASLGEPGREGVVMRAGDDSVVKISARRDRGFALMAEAADVADAAELIRIAREKIKKS